MKSYAPILRSTGQDFREFDAYVFDKLDGSNLRFEWGRKRGWYKYGTRHRMFDHTDPDFGPAIPLFQEKLSEPLTKIARDERWESVVVFAEFWGPQSFAGLHVPGDPMNLTVFDVSPYKKGIMGPREFLKVIAPAVKTPTCFGNYRWTRGFVERIWNGEIENWWTGRTDQTSFQGEGVVGKGGEGHHLVMRKAKTKAWVDKVLARYGEEQGRKIIES